VGDELHDLGVVPERQELTLENLNGVVEWLATLLVVDWVREVGLLWDSTAEPSFWEAHTRAEAWMWRRQLAARPLLFTARS
jgi:hypothetical protein